MDNSEKKRERYKLKRNCFFCVSAGSSLHGDGAIRIRFRLSIGQSEKFVALVGVLANKGKPG